MVRNKRRIDRKARRGFTLLEILLVAAILVILAALSVPAINTSYNSLRCEAGADKIREVMARARLKAMEDGVAYRVAIVPGDRFLRAAPEGTQHWSGVSLEGEELTNGNVAMILEEGETDANYFFLGQSARRAEYDKERTVADVTPDQWTTAAVFFPDGTVHKDVEILIQFRDTVGMVLSVRSLTGAMSVRKAEPDEVQR